MAAYAALVSLSKAIDLILSHEHKYVHLCSRQQMKSLREDIARLQDLLEHLSGRSHPSIDVLESQIRDVAYRMEDIIEDAIHEDDIPSIEDDIPSKISFSKLFFLPSSTVAETPSAFDMCAREVGMLLKEAMEMKEDKLQDKGTSIPRPPLTTTTSSSDQPPTSEMHYLNEDLKEILHRIIAGPRSLQILPITGMGGIGKTAIARAVYQHFNARNRFDICCWVTVSQEYNVNEILRGLLPSHEQNYVPREDLIVSVYKRLVGRRYLIVLDDMWDENAWDCIRNAFPSDNNCSRIILTTRLLDVARYVGSLSSYVHEMQFLNDEQSWDLLRKKLGGCELWPKELEDLGRTISRNCRGLPLAIVTMAGLLKIDKTEEYWKQVASDTKSEAATNYEDHLFGILALSYTNLPPYLKACFLYLGSFEEDYEIPTEEVARLWAAEGFLKPRGSREMEEVAEEYLEELVSRSLVLVKERRPGGRIKTCSLHSLIRELCLRKAKDEKFLHHLTDDNVHKVNFREIRRVSFSTVDLLSLGSHTYDDAYRVRTFLNKSCESHGDLSFILRFKLIKVLNSVKGNQSFLESILCTLTHLRYLHFVCDNNIDSPFLVSESISKLQHLETLIISSEGSPGNGDGYTLVLPVEIWKLQCLRHVILMSNSYLPSPVHSPDFRVLEELQTLIGVTNLDLSESIIKRVPNLKVLKVEYKSISVDDRKEFCMNNLVRLHRLEELAVSCDLHTSQQLMDFLFPKNLKKLTLKGTRIPWENMSRVGCLLNLEVLKLKRESCIGKVWKPVEEEFLGLTYLKMEELLIKYWIADETHFPCLENLIIFSCCYLEEVPGDLGYIETLEKLIVKGRPRVEKSVKKLQQEQQQEYLNDLQVVALR